jgi:hypothetical protein
MQTSVEDASQVHVIQHNRSGVVATQPEGYIKSKNRPSLFKGGVRSQRRLQDLGFDPIGELVGTYRKLQEEIKHQEAIRDGVRVELTLKGTPKAYRPDIHHALYDRLTKIASELLRYGYGRVPELNAPETKPPAALVVNLTKKGEQYVVNDDEPIQQPNIDDWDDEDDN